MTGTGTYSIKHTGKTAISYGVGVFSDRTKIIEQMFGSAIILHIVHEEKKHNIALPNLCIVR